MTENRLSNLSTAGDSDINYPAVVFKVMNRRQITRLGFSEENTATEGTNVTEITHKFSSKLPCVP